MITIDLNSDVGERPEALTNGSEEKLISLITSANVACGGHAGDEYSMKQIIKLCKKYGVRIGAHPSYPDKKNFGRIEMNFSVEEISNFVYDQIIKLVELSEQNDMKVSHVKPHGALYNSAVNNQSVAKAIAEGVKKVDSNLLMVGLAGSLMLNVWQNLGLRIVAEAFADRRYENDGSLRSRKYSDSLIINPEEAANQALSISKQKKIVSIFGKELLVNAQTICIHSDTENSLEILTKIRSLFENEGIIVKALC